MNGLVDWWINGLVDWWRDEWVDGCDADAPVRLPTPSPVRGVLFIDERLSCIFCFSAARRTESTDMPTPCARRAAEKQNDILCDIVL